MLILASDGLHNEKLIDRFRQALPPEAKKAALITTAYKPFGEAENPNADYHKAVLEKLGLRVSFFDIEEGDRNELGDCDVLVILGGNPFYLMRAIRNTGCGALLADFAKRKMLLSISAGSMVLGETLGVACEFTPEMNVGLTDFTGLRITDINVCPHKSTFVSGFEGSEERLRALEERTGAKITCIDDGEAIFVTGEGVFRV